jgi:hypothetical protein
MLALVTKFDRQALDGPDQICNGISAVPVSPSSALHRLQSERVQRRRSGSGKHLDAVR